VDDGAARARVAIVVGQARLGEPVLHSGDERLGGRPCEHVLRAIVLTMAALERVDDGVLVLYYYGAVLVVMYEMFH
jgi:hypothetical protein